MNGEVILVEKKITASNGVDIFYYKQPNTHSICISLYIKTGVLYEYENPGITHFLEHLHFRRLGGRTQKELYYEIESLGGEFEACTYKEFIQFYLTASPGFFSRLVKIAADLLGSLEADAKDFVAEKRLVLSEIREGNQKNDIDFLANKYIWQDTNLQNPVLGSITSVKGLTLAMLHAEKEKVFTGKNIFFYVTGCFDDDDIMLLKKEIEAHGLAGRPCTQNNNNAQIPVNFMNRNAFVKLSQRDYTMHDVKISFDINFSKVSRHNLIYLDSILTDGLCSLLRAEMIEKKGLIYSFSSVIEQYNNIGVYSFNFTVFKSKLYDTVKAFLSVVKKIKNVLQEADMQATRIFKTDNQLQMLDDPEALNWTFAYENHILNNGYADIIEFADTYRNIAKDQLMAAANEIFLPDNVILTSIGNKKGLSDKKLHELLLNL